MVAALERILADAEGLATVAIVLRQPHYRWASRSPSRLTAGVLLAAGGRATAPTGPFTWRASAPAA